MKIRPGSPILVGGWTGRVGEASGRRPAYQSGLRVVYTSKTKTIADNLTYNETPVFSFAFSEKKKIIKIRQHTHSHQLPFYRTTAKLV